MSAIFVSADYRLDPARRELTRAGAFQALQPQVLDLLLDLIEHRERVVSRDELIERIWHGRIVADATLSSRIKSARQAIGDNGRDQALIRTVHGRGFRFVSSVPCASRRPVGRLMPRRLPRPGGQRRSTKRRLPLRRQPLLGKLHRETRWPGDAS
jgi:DNA-binding winged helix-turn-helix (wHTH) protein